MKILSPGGPVVPGRLTFYASSGILHVYCASLETIEYTVPEISKFSNQQLNY